MLDQAIDQLDDESHPIVHSDRGCHYRWPGWIERMNKAKLTRSMSKKGCFMDTIGMMLRLVNEYMEWYREKRIKISLGGKSPMDYRRSPGLA